MPIRVNTRGHYTDQTGEGWACSLVLLLRFETSKAKQLNCSSSPFQKDEHTAYPGVKQKPFMQSSVNATSASSFNSGLQSSNFQLSSSK